MKLMLLMVAALACAGCGSLEMGPRAIASQSKETISFETTAMLDIPYESEESPVYFPIHVEIWPYVSDPPVYTATTIMHGYLPDCEGFSNVRITLLPSEHDSYRVCKTTVLQGVISNRSTNYSLWLISCKNVGYQNCTFYFKPAMYQTIGSIRSPDDCIAFITDMAFSP